MKIKAQPVHKPLTMKLSVPADVMEKIEFYQQQSPGVTAPFILIEATRSFLAGVGDKEFKKAWDAHVEAREKGAPAPATPPAPAKPAASTQPASASPSTPSRT